MSLRQHEERMIDAALARLPEWQPPPGFAMRVAATGAERQEWTPLLLRGLGIAACVSVGAWLGAELLYAGLLSTAVQANPAVLGWVLGCGALLFAWHRVIPGRSRA